MCSLGFHMGRFAGWGIFPVQPGTMVLLMGPDNTYP